MSWYIEAKEAIKKHPIMNDWWALGSLALLWVGALVFFVINYTLVLPALSGKDFVILHYDIVFDIDRLGSAQNLYEFPIINAILVIINSIFAVLVYKRLRIYAFMILVLTLLLSLFLGWGEYLVFLINQR
jgi:hypothetical protein